MTDGHQHVAIPCLSCEGCISEATSLACSRWLRCSEPSKVRGSHRGLHAWQAERHRLVAEGGDVPLSGALRLCLGTASLAGEPLVEQVQYEPCAWRGGGPDGRRGAAGGAHRAAVWGSRTDRAFCISAGSRVPYPRLFAYRLLSIERTKKMLDNQLRNDTLAQSEGRQGGLMREPVAAFRGRG